MKRIERNEKNCEIRVVVDGQDWRGSNQDRAIGQGVLIVDCDQISCPDKNVPPATLTSI